MKRPARTPKRLSESLHKQLNAYAVAASAAGVAVLALVQPSQAEIKYTKMNAQAEDSCFALPPRSGLPRLCLPYQFGSGESNWAADLAAHPVATYESRHAPYIVGRKREAFALKEGAPIDKAGPWSQGMGATSTQVLSMAGHGSVYSSGEWFPWFSGPWADGGKGVKGRYLGLKFSINGQIHYGWMRINVFFRGRNPFVRGLVTGFAWETTPNKGLRAGQTEGGHSVDTGTLGALSAGSVP